MVDDTNNPSNFQLTTALRSNPDVVAQRMEDIIILVHMQTNEVYELSATAARAWELLEAGRTLGEIREQMLLEYNVDATLLERELVKTLALLEEKKLVVAYEDD